MFLDKDQKRWRTSREKRTKQMVTAYATEFSRCNSGKVWDLKISPKLRSKVDPWISDQQDCCCGIVEGDSNDGCLFDEMTVEPQFDAPEKVDLHVLCLEF